MFGVAEFATPAPFSPTPSPPSQEPEDVRMQDMEIKTDQFKLRPLVCKKRKGIYFPFLCHLVFNIMHAGACNHVIVDGRDHYDRKTWAAVAKLEVDV